MTIKNVNPATNEIIGEVEVSTEAEVQEKVAAAKIAQREWAAIGLEKRLEILEDVLKKCEARLDEIGDMITRTMGMPRSLRGTLDLDAGIEYFRWYLENAAEALRPEVSYEDETSINTVYFEPTGVAAAIGPWNFPFCTTFVWQVIPQLIVGNAVISKQASECALVGKIIEECVQASQLPKGVFSEVYGGGDIGDLLIHQDIDLISFTGSTAVGKHIYSVAAEKIIKVVLELGGSAPAIVCEDADIDKVVDTVFFNRFANSGQICDGLKRLIVHKSIAEKVQFALIEMLKSKKIGDPLDESVEIGPLVSIRQANALQEQVSDAVNKGAVVLYGGKKPAGLADAFFEPTLLGRVTSEMKVWNEEVFGPVLPIVTFETEEEAIKLANDTEYGLGGYILTENKEVASRLAGQMKTGMVSVNGTLYLHPSSPFGGYKKSGIGREHGKYGFHELCQIKVISTEK